VPLPGFESRIIQPVAWSLYRLCHPSTVYIRQTFWYRGISQSLNTRTSAVRYPKYRKFQTPLVQLAVTFTGMKYLQSLHFIPTKCTWYAKYIYLSPITSYIFRCLLHHLQEDHCVTCSKTVCIVQCCSIGCAVKYKIYPVFLNLHITFYSTINVTTVQKAYSFRASNAMVSLKMV